MSDKIFGIDLGTTYSCIAKLNEDGTPVVIENFEDQTDTLASAVFFESEDNIIVGDNAKASVEEAGDRVVEYIKRHIGKNDGWGFFANFNLLPTFDEAHAPTCHTTSFGFSLNF
jgi:molecular chaperone DnaK (HSP70)